MIQSLFCLQTVQCFFCSLVTTLQTSMLISNYFKQTIRNFYRTQSIFDQYQIILFCLDYYQYNFLQTSPSWFVNIQKMRFLSLSQNRIDCHRQYSLPKKYVMECGRINYTLFRPCLSITKQLKGFQNCVLPLILFGRWRVSMLYFIFEKLSS